MSSESRGRALIVDDEALIRTLTKRAFVLENFECDAVGDGLEAGDALKENEYDIVVTDLAMPNKDGHLLACEMLELDPKPVIVVVTGCYHPKMMKDLFARGVDEVLVKPVDYKRLACTAIALLEVASSATAGT